MSSESPGRSLAKRRTWYSDGEIHFSAQDEAALSGIYNRYPPVAKKCEYCANEVLPVIKDAGYDAEIIGLRDKYRALFIEIKGSQGHIQIATTGYHEVIQIKTSSGLYYIDSVVHQQYGVHPVDWDTYHALFAYTEDVGQYLIRGPRDWNWK